MAKGKSKEGLLAFVHIPKTAGTTLKMVLQNSFCVRLCNLMPLVEPVAVEADLAYAKRVYRLGLRCILGHSLINTSDHFESRLLRFTFVRDPAKRCLSHFLHKKRAAKRAGKSLSFYEFLEDKAMWNAQTKMIAGSDDLERAKNELEDYLFVGLTERFEESLAVLDELSPYSLRLECRRLHVASNPGDRHEVLDDPDACRLLVEANEIDQQLYDHVSETVYPRFLAAAGLDESSSSRRIIDLKRRPMRYWLCRWFQNGVYRQLVYRRRARKSQAARVAD